MRRTVSTEHEHEDAGPAGAGARRAALRADRAPRAARRRRASSTARAPCSSGSRAASCPSYAVPEADIRAELAPGRADATTTSPGVLHPGIPFAVHTAAGRARLDRRPRRRRLPARRPDLAGYVALDFDAFDEWYEEDERVLGHPRDPFHRVDVRRTSRPVRIELDGEVLAETTRARMLFETQLTPASTPERGRPRATARRATAAPTARTRARRPTGRTSPATRTSPGATRTRSRTARDHGPRRLLGRARRRLRRRRAPRPRPGGAARGRAGRRFGV